MDPKSVTQFQESLSAYLQDFSIGFSTEQVTYFGRYYEFVLKWNYKLHLTTLLSPSDFAIRHILESAFAIPKLLPSLHYIFDVGSGVGVPGIPIAILRPDLTVTLIEGNKNKAIFLSEAREILGINNLKIINQRFEECQKPFQDFCVTTRALEKNARMIPKLLEWGQEGQQYLFWGNNYLLSVIQQHCLPSWQISCSKIPLSNNRLLISVIRST